MAAAPIKGPALPVYVGDFGNGVGLADARHVLFAWSGDTVGRLELEALARCLNELAFARTVCRAAKAHVAADAEVARLWPFGPGAHEDPPADHPFHTAVARADAAEEALVEACKAHDALYAAPGQKDLDLRDEERAALEREELALARAEWTALGAWGQNGDPALGRELLAAANQATDARRAFYAAHPEALEVRSDG